MTRLAEVAEFNPRFEGSLAPSDPVAFVPMSAISAENASTEEAEERPFETVAKGYSCFRRDDILVAKITPCFENNKIAQARISRPIGFGSTEFHVVRPRANTVDARFLLHFLRRDAVRLAGERRMTGSAGQRRVPEAFLAQLEIPLPPLVEQRRVAHALDKVDELRMRVCRALARIDELPLAWFFEMKSQAEWPVKPLGELCGEVIDCPHSTPKYADKVTQHACVRSSDIQGARLVFENSKYVEPVEYSKRIARGRPMRGDVIYCREGARFGNAARIVDQSEVCLGQRMMLFRPHPARATTEFLWAFLSSPTAYALATQSLDGAAAPHVNVRTIVKFPVATPPLPVQEAFSRKVKLLDAVRALYCKRSEVLKELFASAQHRAYSGV